MNYPLFDRLTKIESAIVELRNKQKGYADEFLNRKGDVQLLMAASYEINKIGERINALIDEHYALRHGKQNESEVE